MLILDVTKPDQLFWRGTWIRLTPTQEKLILALAQRPGQMISRDELYAFLYDQDEVVEPQGVAWHMSHLRQLVEAITGHPLPLRSVPRRGWVLNLDPADITIARKPEETT